MLSGRTFKHSDLKRFPGPRKDIGLIDAQSFGLPEGWKVKLYARGKSFYSPEGNIFLVYKDACAAAGVEPMERKRSNQRTVKTDKPGKYVRKVQLKRK